MKFLLTPWPSSYIMSMEGATGPGSGQQEKVGGVSMYSSTSNIGAEDSAVIREILKRTRCKIDESDDIAAQSSCDDEVEYVIMMDCNVDPNGEEDWQAFGYCQAHIEKAIEIDING